jgi:hypothetical protein
LDLKILSVNKILYFGLSPLRNVAGDRRRFVYYAKNRNFRIADPGDSNLDCIVATESTDLSLIRRRYPHTPIIYDLIDAYQISDNILEDALRSIGKFATGQIRPTILPFSKVVARNCRLADAVICSSPEQQKLLIKYNQNVHVILDSHDEFQFMKFKRKSLDHNSLFWEGQPYTLSAIFQYSQAFQRLRATQDVVLDLVTDEYFYKYLGKFARTRTLHDNRISLQNLGCRFRLIEWSLGNVVKTAENTKIGLVPVNVQSSFQSLKPENRMLIMWRLGLPCLASATPSHLRVASVANLQNTFEDSEALFSKVTDMLMSPEMQEENVNRGQKYLSEYHNLDVFLSSWDKVIESVV